MNRENTVNIFKAFCDPIRIEIIELLQLQGSESSICACDLQAKTNLSQSKLSYHMKILCDSSIVKCQFKGKWSHYTLNQKGFATAHKLIDELEGKTI